MAASSIIFACGGGGDNTPAVAALELEITPDGGDPIKLNGADLVPEESAGNGAAGSSTARISLGKITSNKNDTSDTTYEMATGDDTAGTQNEHFVIIGGALFYIGPAVDFETASVADRMFTLKINRYTNADDAANDRNAQPITAVIDLINGKDLPDAPSGLFLRTTNTDGETRKVYTGGDSTITQSDIETAVPTRNLNTLDYGVLAAGADGSTNPVAVGTLAHDTLTPHFVADADDGDGDGDDIFISYHYTLAVGAGAGYSNNLFTIDDENQLSFIGADSDVSPTYLIGIATTIRVTIELPALTGGVKGYYDVDASGDTTDSDTREFSFSGGALSKTDVGTGDTAYRTIDVTAGKIYASDPINAAGKIISFAADTLRLPATPDIYQYHIIVDGTGEVSAVADLPTDGTEFYVLGEAEAHKPTITLAGIKFTDKHGGGIPEIKFTITASNDLIPEIAVDGNTITIKASLFTIASGTLSALQTGTSAGAVAARALVDVEQGLSYNGSTQISSDDDAVIKLSGGAEAVSGGAAAIKAQINIGGLIIEAATAGVAGNNITLTGQVSGVGSDVTIAGIGDSILIIYGSQATLSGLVSAVANDMRLVATGANYDETLKLAGLLPRLHSLAEDGTPEAGADPTANIGTEQTGAHTWTDEATLDPEDFTIKLRPEDSAAEAVPSAAESVPDTDESAAEATPEAEATKPSIGRRILDYLFGSQEEHRQMQNQQAENMFSGDSDLDPITPTDPDIL